MIKIQPISARWRFLLNRIESRLAEDYVQRYDENANGIVESSEFRGNKDVFKRIDRNQDERLELSEVKRYVDLLRQYEPARTLERSRERGSSQEGSSFSVSFDDRLMGSIRDFFSAEIQNLDMNGNGLLEEDEFTGTQEEFTKMDLDGDHLVSSREWAESFLENDTETQMVLKAYRFSEGTFLNSGGIIQVAI